MTSEQTRDLIAALLREREGYVRYDNPDGVKAVDEQLAIYGHKAKAPVKRAQKMTAPRGEEL